MAVELDYRRGLLLVDLQPFAHCLGRIVGAPFRLRAAGETGDQQFAVDIQLHRTIDRLAELLQQHIQRACLGEVARIAVEDETIAGVIAGETFFQHCQHDGVGDQTAGFHHRLGLLPERRARGDRRAQQFASGDVRHAIVVAQAGGLRAFAGARRAE